MNECLSVYAESVKPDQSVYKYSLIKNLHIFLNSMAGSYRTRASAQRVMNTPGRHHFLIIKYFKVNDNDIRQDIVYNVSP